MSEYCQSQTFWDSFFQNTPKQNVVTVTKAAEVSESLHDNHLDHLNHLNDNHLDYKSWDSPYGLIQDVLGSDRKSRKLGNNWRNNDVLIDDGNLLVLKGGILNPYTGLKKRKKKQGWRRSFFLSNDNNFEPSQRISLVSKEEARWSDRYDGGNQGDNTGDITDHDTHQDSSWPANDRASLQLQSDTQYLNLFGFNVPCFIC